MRIDIAIRPFHREKVPHLRVALVLGSTPTQSIRSWTVGSVHVDIWLPKIWTPRVANTRKITAPIITTLVLARKAPKRAAATICIHRFD